MEISIDQFGRIVIPKQVREHFSLKPGSQLELQESDDSIILKPQYGEPNLVEKEGVLVFSGKSVGDLENALEKHRGDRLSEVGGVS